MSKITEMTWMEFDDFRKETDIAIIPIGAVEVYGPHLPLGTDIIVCEEVAKLVSERAKCVIGPSVTIGDSKCLDVFPGTLVARPETFEAYITDICTSLMKWGFKKFLFINSHLTNVMLIAHVCEKLKDQGILCAQVDWWRIVQPASVGIADYEGIKAHGHASEVGTSCMLYLREDLVRKDKIVNQEITYENKHPDIIQYVDFDKMTPNGTIGMGTAATKEKGEKIVNICVDKIVNYIEDVFIG